MSRQYEDLLGRYKEPNLVHAETWRAELHGRIVAERRVAQFQERLSEYRRLVDCNLTNDLQGEVVCLEMRISKYVLQHYEINIIKETLEDMTKRIITDAPKLIKSL